MSFRSDTNCGRGIAPLVVLWMVAHGAATATPTGEREPIVFSNQVARIFQRSCHRCHRPGQMAPMSLMTFAEARPWAKAIKNRVARREMPPWGADRTIGEFSNDPSLTDEEISTIVQWVENGAPEGDRSKLPPPVRYGTGWNIGEPDLILTMENDFEIPANGPDWFEEFIFQTSLSEDRYIKAVEVRPGDRKVVHHALIFAFQEDDFDLSEEFTFSGGIGRGGTLISEYAVGKQGYHFPEGTGRLIKRGAEIRLEIHYHPMGEPAKDRTKVGFKFYAKGVIPRRVISRAIGKFRFRIPPHTEQHRSEGGYTFERPINVLSFQPHMHRLGKAMQFEALYPDGRSQILFSAPDYDFNWQLTYILKRPLHLPAGARINVIGIHDNSANNPNNPDPSVEVYYGRQTTDEMMHGWIDFVYAEDDGR